MGGVREQHESALLLCSTGERWAAIPLPVVRETLRPLPVSLMAGAPAFVLGVAIVRGAPTPVVSLEALLTGKTAAHPLRRFVTVAPDEEAPARRIALAVSEVAGVVQLAAAALGALPSLLGDESEGAITRLGSLDGGLLCILRAANLVPPSLGDSWAHRGAH